MGGVFVCLFLIAHIFISFNPKTIIFSANESSYRIICDAKKIEKNIKK
jgi:hypothetical protein